MGLDNLPDHYDAILSWMTYLARKLYPHWLWLSHPDPRSYASGFESDCIAILAYRSGGRVGNVQGISMTIWLEDLVQLQCLTLGELVDLFKANLHIMLQQAKIVEVGVALPGYDWQGKDELELAVTG